MAGLVQHLPPQQVPRIESLGQDRNYAALWAPSPPFVVASAAFLAIRQRYL